MRQVNDETGVVFPNPEEVLKIQNENRKKVLRKEKIFHKLSKLKKALTNKKLIAYFFIDKNRF